MEQHNDWQNNLKKNGDRCLHLLKKAKWTDCHFLVGDLSNQKLLCGHKLILAMASPVFERMFYGNLPEKTDPIAITDVQPDVFYSMLEYIYSEKTKISSYDMASELYYVANKYILVDLVDKCRSYLLKNLCPTNACRAYEIAKLFDESDLMQRSMEIIVSKTKEVLADPNFCNIEMKTFLTILDCDKLNIDSELDLFNALSRYASERDCMPDYDSSECGEVITEDKNESLLVDGNQPDLKDETSSASKNHEQQTDCQLIKEALKKIRFFTLTPKEFAKGPAQSKLLPHNAAFPILVKLSSLFTDASPMPEGFSTSRIPRNHTQQSGVCGNNGLGSVGITSGSQGMRMDQKLTQQTGFQFSPVGSSSSNEGKTQLRSIVSANNGLGFVGVTSGNQGMRMDQKLTQQTGFQFAPVGSSSSNEGKTQLRSIVSANNGLGSVGVTSGNQGMRMDQKLTQQTVFQFSPVGSSSSNEGKTQLRSIVSANNGLGSVGVTSGNQGMRMDQKLTQQTGFQFAPVGSSSGNEGMTQFRSIATNNKLGSFRFGNI